MTDKPEPTAEHIDAVSRVPLDRLSVEDRGFVANYAAFLCGPTRPSDPEDTSAIGRVPLDRLTVEDRAAVANFAAFLSGDTYVCPACMEPDDDCRPDARCCPGCPGIHITPKAKRTMDGAP